MREIIFTGCWAMSDLQKYILSRKSRDEDFSNNFNEDYQLFKIGVMLKEVREAEGVTQAELATRLHTKKSAISRIENHAEDIKLSTLKKYALSLGKNLEVRIY